MERCRAADVFALYDLSEVCAVGAVVMRLPTRLVVLLLLSQNGSGHFFTQLVILPGLGVFPLSLGSFVLLVPRRALLVSVRER